MPLNIIEYGLVEGFDSIPYWSQIKTYGPYIVLAIILKLYFAGTYNTHDRDLHGKVYMITGGTSGLGQQVAIELANRGAQLILLCRQVDSWVTEYIEEMRESTGNFMIYSEECDLASLYSVRCFATKWLDNSPPRRLDGVICCAAECVPVGSPRLITIDGVERQIGVNYLGHFQLLRLLMPSLRVQPPDRDVRVVLTSCASQSMGEIDGEDPLWLEKRYPSYSPWKIYGTSKLQLSLFAKEFQRRVIDYERKDKAPCNIRVNIVNPGFMRSASTRRFVSMGSLFGLVIYLVLYPFWFIFLKNGTQGAQSVIYSICAQQFAKIDGGNYINECQVINPSRKELYDEEIQKTLYTKTDKLIDKLEIKSAKERNMKKAKTAKDDKASTGKDSGKAAKGKIEQAKKATQIKTRSKDISKGTGSIGMFSQEKSAGKNNKKSRKT